MGYLAVRTNPEILLGSPAPRETMAAVLHGQPVPLRPVLHVGAFMARAAYYQDSIEVGEERHPASDRLDGVGGQGGNSAVALAPASRPPASRPPQASAATGRL